MKIFLCVLLVLLAGCTQPKDFETMSDSYLEPELPLAQKVSFALPAGNLDATLREVTGYGRDKVQLWQRKDGDISRYSCVWVSLGEGGDQMGKATILDDGNYHYVLTVMAAAEDAGELTDTWQTLMESFSIAP